MLTILIICPTGQHVFMRRDILNICTKLYAKRLKDVVYKPATGTPGLPLKVLLSLLLSLLMDITIITMRCCLTYLLHVSLIWCYCLGSSWRSSTLACSRRFVAHTAWSGSAAAVAADTPDGPVTVMKCQYMCSLKPCLKVLVM